MSSHQDEYYCSGPYPTNYESSSEPPVTRRSRPQSWPLTATASDPSVYLHPHSHSHSHSDFQSLPLQSSGTVGSSLQVRGAQDATYFYDYPTPSYSTPGSSSGVASTGTYATYNDDVSLHPFIDMSFTPYTQPDYGFSQHQHGYLPCYPIDESQLQHFFQNPSQPFVQNITTPQTPFVPLIPYSPTQPIPLNHDAPVLEASPACPVSDGLAPTWASTARTIDIDADAGRHSHPPVNFSSNQNSTAGPSHALPSSPERKRGFPWSAEEYPTERRVVARNDRGTSVHSSSSSSPRRSRSNSAVLGRGSIIPQERYTTSSISSYSAPDAHPPITFNLENPDQIGIQITDVLDKTGGFNRLRDRMDAFDMEKKTFTLRVQWPGYEPWSKTIAALDWTKSRAPVTRVKLAEAVATAIRGLLDKYRDRPCDPFYAQWNVGPTGIQLNQICLVALHHVSKGSWQPELCLLGPRR